MVLVEKNFCKSGPCVNFFYRTGVRAIKLLHNWSCGRKLLQILLYWQTNDILKNKMHPKGQNYPKKYIYQHLEYDGEEETLLNLEKARYPHIKDSFYM